MKPAPNVGFRAISFADAEAREDLAEQIFDIDAPRQTPDLVSGNAHVFGRDYAETLERWLAAFDARVDGVRAQRFDERFIRCWRFYLAYCAAGFASGSTDVAQYTLVAR